MELPKSLTEVGTGRSIWCHIKISVVPSGMGLSITRILCMRPSLTCFSKYMRSESCSVEPPANDVCRSVSC